MPKKIDDQKLYSDVVRAVVRLGFGKATTKQLAESAGVNEVTLFRKYDNKANLIRTAFQNILISSSLNELSYTGELEADLIKIVSSYKETSSLYGEIIPMLITEVPRDPELKELMEPFLSVFRSILAIIQKYQKEGLLKEEPGPTAVSALLGPIIVSKMLQRTGAGFATTEIDPASYVQAFLEGRRRS